MIYSGLIEQYSIDFIIGTPPNRFNKVIDQRSSASILLGEVEVSKFIRSKLMLGEHNFTYYNNTVKAYLLQDTISFNDRNKGSVSLMNFQFYYASKYDIATMKRESISFGYKINPKGSLTHLLYNNKKISKLSYAFEPSSMFDGILHFGELNDTLLKEHPNKGKCDVIDYKDKSEWGCKMSSISIGEQTLQMNGIDAYFNVGYYHISVPDYVLRSLVYEIRKYGLCTEYVTMELFSLICDKNGVDKAGNITLGLGNYEYFLNIRSLFDCSRQRCFSLIINEREYKNQVILGNEFLHRFLSIFDYQNKQVYLLSKENIISRRFPKEKILLLIIVVTILMVIDLLYNIIFNLYNK